MYVCEFSIKDYKRLKFEKSSLSVALIELLDMTVKETLRLNMTVCSKEGLDHFMQCTMLCCIQCNMRFNGD